MSLALSKTLDPADFDDLTDELRIVDRYFTSASPQHEMRKWEYAMALRAGITWFDRPNRPQGPVVDVGGAGSPFWKMTNGGMTVVVDPAESRDLASHLRRGAPLASEVYCLSVLEHVDDLDSFLYHLSCLVAPGGLLFLTMDACEPFTTVDSFHFRWMRTRIFDPAAWSGIVRDLTPYGFSLLGDIDWSWHGNHVFDYSFASLALVKRS